MSHANNWANPSNASVQDIAAMASSLEDRSLAHDQQPVNSALINTLAPSPGDRLIEAGCGSGVLCRLLAPQVTPLGRITGLDISPGLISLAQNYAVKAGLADWIDWCSGKAEALPFPDGCFDGALAARLLLHVSKPEVVLKELARVVRPGGKIAAMDWDFETVAVDHSNRELTRRLLHWRCDHYGGNNWSGRQLWKQMADAGLSRLKMVPVVSVAHCEQDSLTISLFRAAQVACAGGEISPAEHDAWVAELKSALAAGSFFASIVYFIVVGER
ncbi:MAG: methyltransferase domain-containing protein [Anaerolineaceae bacterium]|nr:methyltransferase domain-containing protein [Anaerolineaceae bacterium]